MQVEFLNNKETSILNRARFGDQKAGEELFEMYLRQSPPIQRLLRRALRNPEDRMEMLHEIYVQLVCSRIEFRGDSKLSTYVYRVARITILQKYRKENALKRRMIVQSIADHPDFPDSGQCSPEAKYRSKRGNELVRGLIDKLPDSYRLVLKMRVLRDMSYEQIAGEMQLPINTVSTKIHKGKKLLQAACSSW